MRRLKSAASIRRTSGAARDCPLSSGLTRTEPVSPTARRHRHRRCARVPRITRGPLWRRGHRARMRRRRRCRRDRATRCRARVSIKDRVRSGPTGRIRCYPTCCRRRPIRTVYHQRREFRMPPCPGRWRRVCRAPRCRCPTPRRGLGGIACCRPVRLRRRQPSRPPYRPDRRHLRGRVHSYRRPSSRPAGTEGNKPMSTIFDIRKLRLPQLSKAAVIIGSVVAALGLVAALVGWQLYDKLTNNTVVAYFPAANALYAGDKVQILGIRVGAIDKIEPTGDQMKVTFHYRNKYKVPANASAVVLNPTLVASRSIQLEPPYKAGPQLADNAVIPIERTQVPVEWDDLRNSITHIIGQLGPTKEQPKGPFGDVIESFADGLAGKGQQINTTLNSLSNALSTLDEGRGDFFSVLRSLAMFVNALHQDDQQFVALNKDLEQLTDNLTSSDQSAANAIRDTDALLSTAQNFLAENRDALTHDVNNLGDVTTAIMQPEPRDGLETALHILPNMAANVLAIYEPAHGSLSGVAAFTNFANPMEFICSAIQAGSRLGYQDSAELCAQYLAPVLDAIKFNYFPYGINLFSSADTLPKNVAYSEARLQPPPGFKDTTVPGIFSPDTQWSHRNSEPGWIVAPGMQGTKVQQATANLLTPASLSELMGGPDIPPPPPARNMTGPPNAYDENNPLPPPWYPQPLPSPTAAPQ